MATLIRLTSRNHKLGGSPRGDHGGTHKTPDENFQTMKLRKKSYTQDEEGRWYSVEVRQDIATGLVLSRTSRITD